MHCKSPFEVLTVLAHYHTVKYHNVSHNVEETFWGRKRKLQAQ